MPKINVYLSEELAEAVRDAQVPVSAICQAALERAVRDVASARSSDQPPAEDSPGVGLFGRFTPRARQAMALAEKGARAIPHDQVSTEHILLGVLDEGGNVALRVLEAVEIEPADVRAELTASFGPPSRRVEGHIPFSRPAKRALEATAKEALALGHNYIGCEHLLLGLLATDDGLASQVLQRMGLELRTTRRTVISELLGLVLAPASPAPGPESVLDQILVRLEVIEQRLGA